MSTPAEMERIRPTRLHPRHRKFVENYLKTGNATQSAIKAGYSIACASSTGCNLLKLPKVKRAIDSRIEKWDIKADKVLEEVSRIAFGNVSDYLSVGEDGLLEIDFTDTTRPQFAALAEYREDATGGDGDGERKRVLRRTIKMQPKMHALEALMDHLHLRDQRIEVDVSDGLAGRLGGARYRTIEATPDAAQLLIDKHSEQLVTNELTSDDGHQAEDSTMSTSTPMSPEPRTEADVEPSSQLSTSLPPTPPTPRRVPHIPAKILDENEVIGIISSSAVGRDTSFDSAIPAAIISKPACVFCSTHPCCCGTGL